MGVGRILKVEWTLGEPKSLKGWIGTTGGTHRSVTECIVMTQAHDAHIYVKSKRLKHTLSLDTLIKRRKKQYVNLREWNWITEIIWTSTRRPVFRVCDHARLKPTYSVTEISSVECWNIVCSKFINCTFLGANNKGTDQTAWMCRLVCAFDVQAHAATSDFLSTRSIRMITSTPWLKDHQIMKLIRCHYNFPMLSHLG